MQKLAEADDKGMLAGREDRKEAKREAAAAKTEHEVRLGCVFSAQVAQSAFQAAMREYEKDIIPERQQFEARNERKLGTPVSLVSRAAILMVVSAATARHARDDGLPESSNRIGLTESEVDFRATPAFAGAPSRTRSIKRHI